MMDSHIFKLVIPPLVKLLVGNWLNNRGWHLPEKAVSAAGRIAQEKAAAMAKDAGVDRATPEMWWRAVEITQAELFAGRVLIL